MNVTSLLTGNFIGGIIDGIDKLFTSDEERLEKANEIKTAELRFALESASIEAALVQGQLAVNKAEAEHSSTFIAGWRPFIGWVGGIALAYQFILYPLLIWLWALLQAKQVVPQELSPPPILEGEALYALVMGMLGVGGMRSFDKLKGTDSKKVGK